MHCFTICNQFHCYIRISSKPLNLIELSHVTMKRSLRITHTHVSFDHWIFALDFCTGFLSREKTNRFYWILFRSGVTGFLYLEYNLGRNELSVNCSKSKPSVYVTTEYTLNISKSLNLLNIQKLSLNFPI